MMPGWKKSFGSIEEYELAKERNIKVFGCDGDISPKIITELVRIWLEKINEDIGNTN